MSNFNFFSGMLGSSSNTMNGMWNMYSSLGDYGSIKTGSYHKLLNAYYKETKDEEQTTKTNNVKQNWKKDSVDAATKQELTDIKKTTDNLKKSATALLEKGSQSVYGDKDKLASAVKSFVSDYNKTIDQAGDSSSEKVLSKTLSMVNNTKAYAKSLAEIGISVGEDNKLAVDTDKLSKADISTVKNMLQTGSSFAGQTMMKAAQISAAAEQASVGTNLYGSNGNYTYQNVNTFFDSFL